MTILFRQIKPFKFRIAFDLIAKFLGIPQSQIVRAECWRYILFVHRRDRGGQFISYRKLVSVDTSDRFPDSNLYNPGRLAPNLD
ncbi:hypothetical protein [Coleofasciculus sp. H7-2]|uniref:hypothetical protein n=1 Tax=Coleofasciculus sp. H7-2 TaxID=3351545 RepID=UPI0036711932